MNTTQHDHEILSELQEQRAHWARAFSRLHEASITEPAPPADKVFRLELLRKERVAAAQIVDHLDRRIEAAKAKTPAGAPSPQEQAVTDVLAACYEVVHVVERDGITSEFLSGRLAGLIGPLERIAAALPPQ